MLAIGAHSWVEDQIRAPESTTRQSPESGSEDLEEARQPTVEVVLRK